MKCLSCKVMKQLMEKEATTALPSHSLSKNLSFHLWFLLCLCVVFLCLLSLTFFFAKLIKSEQKNIQLLSKVKSSLNHSIQKSRSKEPMVTNITSLAMFVPIVCVFCFVFEATNVFFITVMN